MLYVIEDIYCKISNCYSWSCVFVRRIKYVFFFLRENMFSCKIDKFWMCDCVPYKKKYHYDPSKIVTVSTHLFNEKNQS